MATRWSAALRGPVRDRLAGGAAELCRERVWRSLPRDCLARTERSRRLGDPAAGTSPRPRPGALRSDSCAPATGRDAPGPRRRPPQARRSRRARGALGDTGVLAAALHYLGLSAGPGDSRTGSRAQRRALPGPRSGPGVGRGLGPSDSYSSTSQTWLALTAGVEGLARVAIASGAREEQALSGTRSRRSSGAGKLWGQRGTLASAREAEPRCLGARLSARAPTRRDRRAAPSVSCPHRRWSAMPSACGNRMAAILLWARAKARPRQPDRRSPKSDPRGETPLS